jgi:hypothetical protein
MPKMGATVTEKGKRVVTGHRKLLQEGQRSSAFTFRQEAALEDTATQIAGAAAGYTTPASATATGSSSTYRVETFDSY